MRCFRLMLIDISFENKVLLHKLWSFVELMASLEYEQ